MSEQRIAEAQQRYMAALHKMQSGVAALIAHAELDGTPFKQTDPKHLRVGINSAFIDSAALAVLLLEKGIFTEAEHAEALAKVAEREAELYQKEVQALYPNKKIVLG
jgi:hypothetical protein